MNKKISELVTTDIITAEGTVPYFDANENSTKNISLEELKNFIPDGGVDFSKLDPSLFQASKTSNGYQKLPGGLIIQWGTSNAHPNNGSVGVTFPIPFPNLVFVVLLTALGSANNSYERTVSNKNVSGFTINGTTSFSAQCDWISIGF